MPSEALGRPAATIASRPTPRPSARGLAGDWGGAARRLDDLLVRWPTDVLALMFGHQLDFFIGDAQSLRDRPIRSLREFDPRPSPRAVRAGHGRRSGWRRPGTTPRRWMPGWPPSTPTPTTCGRSTPSCTPTRCRAASTRASASCTSDRTQLGGRQPVHRPQLVAPRAVRAGGRAARAGRWPSTTPRSTTSSSLGVPIEMLDASALLWRMRLDGIDTGGRFGPLADCVGAEGGRRAVVRVQRPARHDGAGRRRPVGRGPRGDRPARPVARTPPPARTPG